MKFQLTQFQLEAENLKKELANANAGAFCAFEGWVRNTNDGREVVALEYEAYEKLCGSEAEKILSEAKAAFKIIDACCVHRTGNLKVGEMAVWVGVTSGHRDSAFKACRYIMDEVKVRLPIWKKEFYTDGDSGWVNTQASSLIRV